MSLFKLKEKEHIPCGKLGHWGQIIVRLLQWVSALIIFAIFLDAVVKAHINHGSAGSAWVYAAFVGGLSWLTATLFWLPFVKSFVFFWFDFLLFILHTPVVGIFGKAYYSTKGSAEHTDPQTVYVGPVILTMDVVVIFAVISGILWLISGLWGLFVMLRFRRKLKKHDSV
jgi:branched-subunit amino acid transport protein